MAREQIWTGPVLAVDKNGNEWPAEAVPEGSVVEFMHRGIEVSFAQGRDVELGIGLIGSGGHMSFEEGVARSAFTSMTREELGNLIHTLKRAGRETFGISPW